MDDGEGISGTGDEIIGFVGERGIFRVDGEGEYLIPFIIDGVRNCVVVACCEDSCSATFMGSCGCCFGD